jgi:hypothetical protein
MRFLCSSVVVALVLARQEPSPMPKPKKSVHVITQRYSLKAQFGKDEVLFLLRKDDDFRSVIDGAEKRSLDTPKCVEVRPSPLGGVGLFTTKNCLPGDLLLAERPLVSTIAPALTSIDRINMHNSSFW